jgi:hypothetical protein
MYSRFASRRSLARVFTGASLVLACSAAWVSNALAQSTVPATLTPGEATHVVGLQGAERRTVRRFGRTDRHAQRGSLVGSRGWQQDYRPGAATGAECRSTRQHPASAAAGDQRRRPRFALHGALRTTARHARRRCAHRCLHARRTGRPQSLYRRIPVSRLGPRSRAAKHRRRGCGAGPPGRPGWHAHCLTVA